jgi:hypothetical protein
MGITCWAIGFVFRLGYIYIRVGETCTAFKFVAVTMSFRLVQDFTFLKEQDGTFHQDGVMLRDVGGATLQKTALFHVTQSDQRPSEVSNQ